MSRCPDDISILTIDRRSPIGSPTTRCDEPPISGVISVVRRSTPKSGAMQPGLAEGPGRYHSIENQIHQYCVEGYLLSLCVYKWNLLNFDIGNADRWAALIIV
jgi:hypothetical protein